LLADGGGQQAVVHAPLLVSLSSADLAQSGYPPTGRGPVIEVGYFIVLPICLIAEKAAAVVRKENGAVTMPG
jgi:hypothetical protein